MSEIKITKAIEYVAARYNQQVEILSMSKNKPTAQVGTKIQATAIKTDNDAWFVRRRGDDLGQARKTDTETIEVRKVKLYVKEFNSQDDPRGRERLLSLHLGNTISIAA